MEILNLANYVISRCNHLNKEIDYISLQNLLTLIQGYTLCEFNIPAFDNEIKLGDNSSVISEVFEKFKNERNKPLFISKDQKIIQPNYPFNLIFDSIIEAYENFSYAELKSLINEPYKTVTKEKLRSLFKNFNPLNLDIKRIIDNDEEEYEKFVDFILKRDHKIFEALS